MRKKVREELGHMITYKVKATTTSWVQVPTRAGKNCPVIVAIYESNTDDFFLLLLLTSRSTSTRLGKRVVQVLEEGRVKEGKVVVSASCIDSHT